jgi:putative SOS response-associated peptidase YedK
MCGRYQFTSKKEEIEARFAIESGVVFEANANVAPTQKMPVIVEQDRVRFEIMKWGLVPSWAKEEAIGSKMFNARSETVPDKPAFRSLWKKKRCLVPMNGFYEWAPKEGKSKQAWKISVEGLPIFTLAGLYTEWEEPEGSTLLSFTILTRAATEPMAWLHDRMPLILSPEQEASWLNPDTEEASVLELIASKPALDLVFEKTTVGSTVAKRSDSTKQDGTTNGQLSLFGNENSL